MNFTVLAAVARGVREKMERERQRRRVRKSEDMVDV
jgi:hypothetical protein